MPQPESNTQPLHGFTLIELLVVITIIVVLLALLAPALDRAIDQAEKAQCLMTQHTMVQGALTYAIQGRRVLPPAEMEGISQWSFDLRGWSGDPLPPRGLGLLVPEGLLPSTQLGKAVHCPTYDNSANADPNLNGHCMDVLHNFGAGGSWWVNPAFRGVRIIMGYNYRAASHETMGKGRMRLGNSGANFVLTVDVMDPRFGVLYGHEDGYNRAFGDGSGGFFHDPEQKLDAWPFTNGTNLGAVDGHHNAESDEQMFQWLARADASSMP